MEPTLTQAERPDGTLLFMHISKTAGTSIREALAQVFREDERVFIYGVPPGIPEVEFRALPSEQRAPRLVFGHYSYGLHKAVSGPSRYVTVLRHPVDRAMSLYGHYAHAERSAFHERIAAGWTIPQLLDAGLFLEADNGMVRMIAGTSPPPPFGGVTSDHLRWAMDNIASSFEAVLVMDEDVRSALERIVGRPVPEIKQRNVGKSTHDVDPAVRARLAVLNPFDLALYEYARALADHR